MFTIDMLPGGRGDALWIEYGTAKKTHRVMIDGGIASTDQAIRARISKLPLAKRRFDCLVVTHIDLDHIAGILELLASPPDGLKFDNVLFNGWEQLLAAEKIVASGQLGSKYGERLTYLIDKLKYPLNKGFTNKLVAIRKPTGALPSITLTGGMTLTLLSPTVERLKKLTPAWEKEIKKAKLKPGQAGEKLEGLAHPEDVAEPGLMGGIDVDRLAKTAFKDDSSPANGSSIAVLAEYGGKRCAFLGDAYSSDVAKAFDRIIKAEGDGPKLEVDAIKLSHHGGRKNTGVPMLERVRCRNYLVSTDGSYYDHPHGESLSRVLVAGSAAGKPSLIFNYESDETKPWKKKSLYAGKHPYEPVFPDGGPGISTSL